MTDRILHLAWNGLILGLTVILGASALALVYLALLRLVAKRLDQGIVPLILGFTLGAAVWLLLRHRDDLTGNF